MVSEEIEIMYTLSDKGLELIDINIIGSIIILYTLDKWNKKDFNLIEDTLNVKYEGMNNYKGLNSFGIINQYGFIKR